MAIYEPIIEALNRAEVRYVVVGGLAVVLHGHVRMTVDLDVLVDLSPGEARKAVRVLVGEGLVPVAPVDAEGFADESTRAAWVREKHLRVFSLRDPNDPLRQVDLFVENPMDFEEVYARAQLLSLGATEVRVASIPDLISMKRMAGRPQDLIDIEALEAMLEGDG